MRCLPSKPPLIEGWREWRLFLTGVLAVALLVLGWRYWDYRRFVAQKRWYTDADVLLHYTKGRKGRRYAVLKLQTPSLTFYTTSYKKLANLRGKRVRLVAFPKRVRFVDYLTTPYIPSRILSATDSDTLRMRLARAIERQHTDSRMAQIYGALLLGLPVAKELRESIARLGISHLLALSGFHVGILWGWVYGTLALVYRPMHRRFFPWRLEQRDLGIVSLMALGGYLWLAGAPPSLVRAFGMALTGWLALMTGVELVSFAFLLFCVAALLALMPWLALSLGFWLSVAGVFWIYLFLRHSEGWPLWLRFVGLNLWTWLVMVPVVHLFFSLFSPAQVLSPVLTALFVPFYPVALVLHLVGWGGLLDGWLASLLSWGAQAPAVSWRTPWWLALSVGGMALLAVRYRVFFYLLFVTLVGLWVGLVEQVA